MNQHTLNPNQQHQQPPGHAPQGRPVQNIPAGHARDEQLKQNTDNLQRRAEQRSNNEERYALDPNKIRPIREIRHSMSALNVSNKQPGYTYCWVNFKSPIDTPGLAIQQKQAIQVQNPITGYFEAVWEVVNGTMPEAQERKGVDSLRKLGDVLLMRAKTENADAVEVYHARQGQRRLQADEAKMMDLGEKANSAAGGGIIIHPKGHPSTRQSHAGMPIQGIPNAVPSLDQINRQIKNGGLPGAEVENWAGK